MFIKFGNNWQIALALGLLWVVCNLLSVIGFYSEYKATISGLDVVLGNNITGIFSLPKSFSDSIHLTDRHDISWVFPIAVVFWSLVIYLVRKMFVKKYVFIYFILTVIFLLASWGWLIVSMGFKGI